MSEPASSSPADTLPPDQHRDWALRPFVLSAMLAAAGFLFQLIADPSAPNVGADQPWRMALATFSVVMPLMLAFTLEERGNRGAAIFALIIGAVMAGIAWRVAAAQETHADAPFWFFAAALSGLLALPLYQAGFHRRRWDTPYALTHRHVWTDAISAGGALAFTGLSWLLLALLAALFSAIKIDVLGDLMDEAWFGWTFSGVAFGAALGVLRNQGGILATLQKVVMMVFALLAVPLAAALVLFLVAVALSGVDVLWDATRSATPLLLTAALGAFVLANAVLRDSDAEMSGSRVQRIAAAALALGILPLALLAALSMGVRIDQHGLSPERLWALIAIAVAVAYGVGYFVAAILARRQGWGRLRLANLHLAVGTCVLALLLALPILDFGAISARDQIARLESGRVSAEDFDYDALRWDFGDAGRAALARLARSKNGEVARLAAEARDAKERRYRSFDGVRESADDRAARLARLRVEGASPHVRAEIEAIVRRDDWRCIDPCVAIDLGPAVGRGPGRLIAFVQNGIVTRETILDDTAAIPPAVSVDVMAAEETGGRGEVPQTATSKVEVREWTGRRIYVDGRPTGPAF